jgi:hypothetical protein
LVVVRRLAGFEDLNRRQQVWLSALGSDVGRIQGMRLLIAVSSFSITTILGSLGGNYSLDRLKPKSQETISIVSCDRLRRRVAQSPPQAFRVSVHARTYFFHRIGDPHLLRHGVFAQPRQRTLKIGFLFWS